MAQVFKADKKNDLGIIFQFHIGLLCPGYKSMACKVTANSMRRIYFIIQQDFWVKETNHFLIYFLLKTLTVHHNNKS